MRREWEELPPSLHGALEVKTGRVIRAVSASAGRHSELSATLHTDSGVVFCKGITVDHPYAQMHRNEARVNPYLPPLAPRLLWQIETDGWLLLGFERVTGQHADLSPGSPDLALIADSVVEIGLIPAPPPDVARRSFAARWSRLSAWQLIQREMADDLDPWTLDNIGYFIEQESQSATLLDGDCLLHTDLHSLNILVDNAARVIDWAWWRIGAPIVDIGFLVARLIAAGHSPETAEQWAATIPAWRAASEETRTVFAVALLGVWEWLARSDPLPLRPPLTAAARAWTRYRLRSDP